MFKRIEEYIFRLKNSQNIRWHKRQYKKYLYDAYLLSSLEQAERAFIHLNALKYFLGEEKAKAFAKKSIIELIVKENEQR